MGQYSKLLRIGTLSAFVMFLFFFPSSSAVATTKIKTYPTAVWGVETVNNHHKVTKKRKSKKFLGIFKRKSNCGCPKHK